MSIKVSIVVPIYNVEKYLFKCLDSLAKQTLDQIEVLCVNDGSTDQSQSIIDDFVLRYPHIFKSFTKQNGGLSDARNYGVKFCTGDYLGFIDGDDYIDPNHFEILYTIAVKDQSNLVLCDVKYEWENTDKSTILKGYQGNEINKKRLFLSPLFAWNKLYKREFFVCHHFEYPLNLWYEDIPVTCPIFALCSNFSYTDKTAVHYMQRTQSIMGSKSNIRMFEIFTILDLLIKKFTELGLENEFKNELEYVAIEQLMLYGSFRAYRSDFSKQLMSQSFKWMSNHFPKWKSNIYIKELPLKYRWYLKTLSDFTLNIFSYIVKTRG